MATLNEVEIRDETTNAIHFLAEEETNLLLEIKLLGRSFKEMAKQMGKTENALKVMLHRTLKSIRERL